MIRDGKKVSIKEYCLNRKKPTNNELKIYLEEVDCLCPISGCGKSLVNIIDDIIQNQYEIAHVFPNSPTPEEKKILKDVEVDGINSESMDNKIALCRDCHKNYDNQKSIETYNNMLELKRQKSAAMKAKKTISKESIEDDLLKVIKTLSSIDKAALDNTTAIEYKSLKVAQKVSDKLLCYNIEKNVTSYFNYVKDCFKLCDPAGYNFELVCLQMKKLYVSLKAQHLGLDDIHDHIVDWLKSNSDGKQIPCDIIFSFFVQNCDIYEVSE